jgi:hypothetical protein
MSFSPVSRVLGRGERGADARAGYNVFKIQRFREPVQIVTGLAAGLIRYVSLLLFRVSG